MLISATAGGLAALEAHLQQGEVLEGGEAIGVAAGDEGGAELRG